MNPIRKQRLYALVAILIGSLLATWLVVSALSQNMNLFYSPTDIKAAEVDEMTLIRAGGMVKQNSIIKDTIKIKNYYLKDNKDKRESVKKRDWQRDKSRLMRDRG